eukprot:4742002-Amphidinium_carterae.2
MGRLARVQHVPGLEARRAMLTSATAMSPLGWVPLGIPLKARERLKLLTMMVKSIHGHCTMHKECAYEILVAVEMFSASDQEWVEAMRSHAPRRHSALGALQVAAKELMIDVEGGELVSRGCTDNTSTADQILDHFDLMQTATDDSKHRLREFVRCHLLRKLARRRPVEFTGVEQGVQRKLAEVVIGAQASAARKTLARRWLTGSFITSDRWLRHSQKGTHALCCACQVPDTWRHVLWECPKWRAWRAWLKHPSQPELACCTKVCGLVPHGQEIDRKWLRLYAASAVEIYLQYHAQETSVGGYQVMHIFNDDENQPAQRRIPRFDDAPPTLVASRRIRHKRPLTLVERLSLVPGGAWSYCGHRVHKHWSKSGKLRYRCYDCELSAVPRYRGIWAQHTCYMKRDLRRTHASKGKAKQSRSRLLEAAIATKVPHIVFDRSRPELWLRCQKCGVQKKARPVEFCNTFAEAHSDCV